MVRSPFEVSPLYPLFSVRGAVVPGGLRGHRGGRGPQVWCALSWGWAAGWARTGVTPRPNQVLGQGNVGDRGPAADPPLPRPPDVDVGSQVRRAGEVQGSAGRRWWSAVKLVAVAPVWSSWAGPTSRWLVGSSKDQQAGLLGWARVRRASMTALFLAAGEGVCINQPLCPASAMDADPIRRAEPNGQNGRLCSALVVAGCRAPLWGVRPARTISPRTLKLKSLPGSPGPRAGGLPGRGGADRRSLHKDACRPPTRNGARWLGLGRRYKRCAAGSTFPRARWRPNHPEPQHHRGCRTMSDVGHDLVGPAEVHS